MNTIYHQVSSQQKQSTYGLPRIYAAMRKEGFVVNKKRLARLMRENISRLRQGEDLGLQHSRIQKHSQVKIF